MHPLDPDDWRADAAARFAAFLTAATDPILVVGHFDADGLSAAALLTRALRAAGRTAEPLIVGKGETPWEPPFADRLRDAAPGGLIVTDLGVHAAPVLAHVPTVLIDHHVPTGWPEHAVVVSGNGLDPEPTSALLAHACAGVLGDQADLGWLAALGLIGDMAEDAGWPELAAAQARWTKTALRNATSLVNAPRRTAAADATPALALLMKGDGPKDVLSGRFPETADLNAAKAEVKAEMDVAKRVAPRVAGEVALIAFSSPCQIHPLIAQQWRGRLKDKVVIAANTGYRPGWVHFAARTATGRDLLAFLAERRPEGADSRYGNGHRAATGGALTTDQWNDWVAQLGFPEQKVAA